MNLSFTHSNRILTLDSVSALELKQLHLMLTAKGFNWRTKEKWEKNFVHQNRYIPAGFWKRVASLRKNKYHVDIKDIGNFFHTIDREDFDNWLDDQPLKFAPRWYQAKGAFLAIKYRMSRGQFATSAGKSFIQYIVARYVLDKLAPNGKVLIIVPSKMLVTQMEGDFADYQTDDFISVDKVSGGIKRNKEGNVVVGNIDSLSNYDLDFFKQFDAVMVDEAHKLSTKGYMEVLGWLDYDKLKLIYSVSGTFHADGTLEDLTAESYSGPILMNVSAKQLMDEGSVAELKIKVFNLRHPRNICEAYYNHEDMQSSDLRDLAERRFLNTLPERFKTISTVVSRVQGNQLLLFKTRDSLDVYYRFLKKFCPDKEVYQIHGGIKSSERTEICKRLEEIDNGVLLGTYGTMSTGVSVKRLKMMHMIESGKSFIMIRQSIGRILRLCTFIDKHVTTIDWVDIFKKWDKNWDGPHSNVSANQSRARKKIYKEQEFEFSVKDLNL